VANETDENLKSQRISLLTTTANVLKNGLALLGIEAPEEM
jgi:arginyl-tRNA synthetase